MDLGLKNRVAIVAASSQGLGRAIADAFAGEGARLAMCSRDEKKLSQAAHQIRERHKADIYCEPLDVTDFQAVHRFVENVARHFGRIDICVTNAGGPPAKNFLATTMEEWRRATELNFLSTVAFAHEVIPHMQRNRWGRIVTLTSVSVRQPVADLVLSNAVRAGVMGLVKSLSNEFGKDGILVNNVGPGYAATERLNELAAVRSLAAGKERDEIFQDWAAASAVKRVGKPEEIADTVVWLASERASYITGQTVLADGGLYKGL